MPTPVEEFSQALAAHAVEFAVELHDEAVERLKVYYVLLSKWNERLHLVAPCAPKEFAIRHVLESLLLLKHLPAGARVIDVGSGAGLPIIPCLLVRDDLQAALIESSQKKAVFLREALRQVRPSNRAAVVVARFEDTLAPEAGYLTCRALDRFGSLLPKLVAWAPPGSTLLLYGGPALRKQIEHLLPPAMVERIPQSDNRLLFVARRTISPPNRS